MDGPDIEDGGEYYFWKDTVEFLDVKISLAMEPAINGGRDSKALLDDVGLTNEVQLLDLRIKSDDDESILISLQAQKPEDALPLAKQYIQHLMRSFTMKLSEELSKDIFTLYRTAGHF